MKNKETQLEGAPFVVKTYQLLSDSSNKEYASWSESRESFIVWNPVDFAAEVLPKYFKHNNFCSFIRQLNTYGFHKLEANQWEFRHELFQEGGAHLLKQIQRRKSKKRDISETNPQDDVTPKGAKEDSYSNPFGISSPCSNPSTPAIQSVPTTPTTPSVPNLNNNQKPVNLSPASRPLNVDPVEGEDEVDRLKQLNTVLMKEVLRLQQQQDSTHGTIKQILDELIHSRKEQQFLHNKVEALTSELQKTEQPVPLNNLVDTADPFANGMMLPQSQHPELSFDFTSLDLTNYPAFDPELELLLKQQMPALTPPVSPSHN